ncbi:MAG: hypothetical protein QG612_1585 [Pseudomonadota bacterium]|nr:hypothetical protein [Pseudomonadota bacterium]
MSVFALLLPLSGCSTVGLAYRQADTLAWWWLDRRVDFDAAQAPRVRQALAQWLDWHRRRPLAEDVALLDEIAREAGADTRAERTCRWWQLVHERQGIHLQALAGGMLPDVLATLSDAQLRHLQQALDDDNREWRERFLRGDADQRLRAARERAIERAEQLYGRLDAAQRRFIGERMRGSPWDATRGLAERQRQQRDLLETLQALRALPAGDHERRVGLLQALAQRLVDTDDPEARQYRDQLRRFQCELAADLHNRTEADQRREAVQRLQGWARDLRAAGAQITPAGP